MLLYLIKIHSTDIFRTIPTMFFTLLTVELLILFDIILFILIIKVMENIEKVFSKNLTKYRTSLGLTQAELAKQINYSDKSISKWERGEGLPDLKASQKISEIFGISIDDLLKETIDHEKTISTTIVTKNKRHFLISMLSAGLVWLIATVVYVSLLIFKIDGKIWLPFIYAIPVSSIVLTVFSSLWGKLVYQLLSVSLIMWGIIFSIACSVPADLIWFICVIGAVGQILILLWFALKKLKHKKSK